MKIHWVMFYTVVQELGTVGIVGLALVAYALMFFASAVAPAHQSLATLNSELAQLESAQTKGGALRNGSVPEKTSKPIVLEERALPDVLDLINRAATKHGLSLQKGAYKWAPKENGLGCYEVKYTIKAGYRPVRDFVTQLAADYPFLAIRRVSFSRATLGSHEISSDVDLLIIAGTSHGSR